MNEALAAQAADWHAAAATQVEDYTSLAREYAAQGDARRAVLATWAADLMTLQCLLWENGLGQAPEPATQLAAVGDAVAGSLRGIEAAPDADLLPRAAVEAARGALTATFDASVHALLSERLVPLDHLDRLAPPETAVIAVDRLGDRSVDELLTDLLVTAQDCRAVARALSKAGLADAAADQQRMGDLAAFEAHLVHAAVTAGDRSLVTVDLRWALAGSLVMPGGPLREPLVRAVAPVEGSLLMDALPRSADTGSSVAA